MKKVIVGSLVTLFLATAVFAAQQITSPIGNNTSTMTVPVSTGVKFSYNGTSSNYVLNTWHANGTYSFGTSAGDVKMYKCEGTGKYLETVPSGSQTVVWDSWQAQ